jgi:UDP-N-acetylglucosamine 2-epimerase (non-hydrolysing)
MTPKKILTIFGTRPEATKMAPVVAELQKYPQYFDVRVAVTGQHREQLDQVLRHFNLTPHVDLNIMQHRQSLAQVLTRALEGLERVTLADKPDLIMVHGDTSTTMAGSLIGLYHQVEVAHVEAGLRTYDLYSPWPEEANRRIVDVLANIFFAPTALNRDNLLAERTPADRIFVTGQTAVDAALATVQKDYTFAEPRLRDLPFGQKKIVAVTAHRRENWGEPMRRMFSAMRDLVEQMDDVVLVYPVHLSPAVREVAFPILQGHDRIILTDPIEYPDMINLMARSQLVLTDSGGLQEETPSLGVPLVLMRENTERPEGVAAGTLVLAGTSRERIRAEAMRLLTDQEARRRMIRAANPFGDGRASERIAQYLAWHWGFIADKPAEFA